MAKKHAAPPHHRQSADGDFAQFWRHAWRFILRLGLASLRVAAVPWIVKLHHYVESGMDEVVQAGSAWADVLHGGTSLAFVGVWIILLYDMVLCFWPGKER